MSATSPKNLANRCLLLFLGPHMTRLSYSLFQLSVLTSRKPQAQSQPSRHQGQDSYIPVIWRCI